jgi:hypothetical protein
MRPFPRVEPVYLSTFVKNFLLISGQERTDFSIIQHTHNRQETPDPAIRGVMLGINKVYSLYAETPHLGALKAEHLDAVAGLVQTALGVSPTTGPALPAHRGPGDPIPIGCLTTVDGTTTLERSLERMRALESAGALQKAQFAWLLPFRWAFSAPYLSRNLETGVMIFLLLRMHWGLPFHLYGWTREELWRVRNAYSQWWLRHDLWEDPDLLPDLPDREPKLIGTEL